MIYRIFFLALLFLTLQLKLQAQDPVFSQFYNAPVYLNPALIGDEDNVALNISHRSQWESLHFPYQNSQASFIYPIFNSIHEAPVNHIGGMALSFYNNVAGTNKNFKTLGGNASFAYNLQLESDNINRISFGMQIGFINKRVDPEGLQWGSQYDPFVGWNAAEIPAEVSQFQDRTYLDITPGIFWRFYNKRRNAFIQSAYSGIAVSHLNNPNESVLQGQDYNLPLLYKYHGGMIFGLSDRASVSANVLSIVQDRENQTNFGAFLSYLISNEMNGTFGNVIARIGGWYRRNDAFILSTEFLTNTFQFGFSYDWNVTSLNNFEPGTGAYEISLGLRFNRFAPPKVRY
ncbi:MAG: PorP/SprF family type IX secretion system membrane protein [Candidatus Cyclobacteriaceae bacterium M3_2C_046]